MTTRLTYVCMVLLLAAACQTPGAVVAPTQPGVAVWQSEFPLKELPQQSVNTDECGLALWARGQGAQRIFFAVNARRFAVINFDGAQIRMSAQHERKALVRGFSETQLYEGSGLAVALDLTIETRQDVIAGAVVRDGVLTLTQGGSGRTLVVPVVGVIGCS